MTQDTEVEDDGDIEVEDDDDPEEEEEVVIKAKAPKKKKTEHEEEETAEHKEEQEKVEAKEEVKEQEEEQQKLEAKEEAKKEDDDADEKEVEEDEKTIERKTSKMLGGTNSLPFALDALCVLNRKRGFVEKVKSQLKEQVKLSLRELKRNVATRTKNDLENPEQTRWHPVIVQEALKSKHNSTLIEGDNFVFKQCAVHRFEVGKSYLVDGILNRSYFDVELLIEQKQDDYDIDWDKKETQWTHCIAVLPDGDSHAIVSRGLWYNVGPITHLHMQPTSNPVGFEPCKTKGFLYSIKRVYEICGNCAPRGPPVRLQSAAPPASFLKEARKRRKELNAA
jgi:hypothetical protein